MRARPGEGSSLATAHAGPEDLQRDRRGWGCCEASARGASRGPLDTQPSFPPQKPCTPRQRPSLHGGHVARWSIAAPWPPALSRGPLGRGGGSGLLSLHPAVLGARPLRCPPRPSPSHLPEGSGMVPKHSQHLATAVLLVWAGPVGEVGRWALGRTRHWSGLLCGLQLPCRPGLPPRSQGGGC